MIKTILFAADLGVYTPFLLQHVNDLAIGHGGNVVIVHVVEPAGEMAEAIVRAYLPEVSRAELEQDGRERVARSIKGRIVDLLEDEFMDGHDGLSRVNDVRVGFGHPVSVILDEARNCQADLIVMGSHGHRSMNPALLGSVTSKVLQMSRVPVYMVPMVREFPAESWLQRPPQRGVA